MAQTAQAKISEISAKKNSYAADFSCPTISIRVPPNSYSAVVFLTTFFTAFFVYLEQDLIAAILFVLSLTVLPILAWTDRIAFDGKKLWRTGLIPRFWNWLNHKSQALKLIDIEQVETQAQRAVNRGGSVFYRYRTSVIGKDKHFVFASGGENYRRMARKLFAMLSPDALDNRSIELRDYLSDPKEIFKKAEYAELPSPNVLENSLDEFQDNAKSLRLLRKDFQITDKEIEKTTDWRRLANELRLTGNLLQSLEAFRRALIHNPFDARLIFDAARCLHSYAGLERNEKLKRKARAALRLVEIRAGKDGELLTMLGENYFQYGDWIRARASFQKALMAGAKNFRAMRGLAEIALREGKIAYVIQHFTEAMNFADTKALKRWAQGETQYFSRLNSDEEYMELEVARMNWLENIENAKKMSLRFALVGFLMILFGIALDDTIANVGWACACASLLIWAGLIMSRNLLAERSPIENTTE